MYEMTHHFELSGSTSQTRSSKSTEFMNLYWVSLPDTQTDWWNLWTQRFYQPCLMCWANESTKWPITL